MRQSLNEDQAEQRERRRLEALRAYDVLDTPREKDFDDIAALASRICATPIAVVNLIDDRRQFFKAEVGLGVRETPFDSSFCAKAILEDDFLMIPDASQDSRFNRNPLVTGEPHLRFYAGAVLKTADNLPIGTVCVLGFEPKQLDELQQDTLKVLARQVMVQLELRKALKEKAREAEVQRRLSERRLARVTAMEQQDERSRSAQAAGRVGTFELDIATNTMTVSSEFCRVFGIPVQTSYPASTIEDLVHEDDRGLRSNPVTRREGSASPDVDYRIIRADDDELRWISRRARFVHNEKGEITRMVGVVFDTTDAKLKEAKKAALLKLGDELRAASTVEEITQSAAAILSDGLGVARAGYAVVDRTDNSFAIAFDWASHGTVSLAGRHSLERFSETVERLCKGETLSIPNVASSTWLTTEKDAYASIGVSSLIKVPILKGGSLVGILFAHDDKPRTWSQDELDFTRGIADRTYAALAKVQAEEEQELLNHELSHRLKNTLAMVQAIAGQTLKDVSEKEAVNAFLARLHALGAAHDVLLRQNWSAAKMRDVIEKVLALHADGDRIYVDGPDLALGPKAGLSLSLLLHELATNALKYGALSNNSGRVSIKWWIADNDAIPTLSMTWTESGGPTVSEPTRKGFGSRLIRMGLAGTGNAHKDYRPSGLTATFHAPLTTIQETGNESVSGSH
ncbi:HWE histidine kinase domain-containing protein [Agrobacterium vitis]|uniref:Blue-light-activated histidine kinase n=1 Tax=Agrobacterium vitis TaxID=373 RepID=A0A7K1RA19_AGRVI|nr:HWE histidine kinase domain-containing protein [Agrobacterium vitis]MVA54965.1 GAF domain-containing protein [Agrobacterium vitis]